MKKYGYYRLSVSRTGPARRPRKKASTSIFKIFIFFCAGITLFIGGWWAFQQTYKAISNVHVGEWKPSSVVVSGVTGALANEIISTVQPKVQAAFSAQEARALQTDLLHRYPQLWQVEVKRGLFSGKLKISVKRRVPLARFKQQGKIYFMDEQGTVYVDPQPDPLQSVQEIKLIGKTPENLSKDFADFVSSVLKLQKELHFSTLQFDLKADTVSMFLPDGSVLNFGPPKQLHAKARRAAQIQAHAQQSGRTPYEANFAYFEDGKVFLRQKAP